MKSMLFNLTLLQEEEFGEAQPLSVSDQLWRSTGSVKLSPRKSDYGILENYRKKVEKVKKVRECCLCRGSGHDRRNCPLKSLTGFVLPVIKNSKVN